MSGTTSYHAGLAAEDIVSRHYLGLGYQEEQRRWRGPGGEIDLVLANVERTIFVEVKKSRDHASAAARVTPRQLSRVAASAEVYIAESSHAAMRDARIDVALVDASGFVEVLENVSLH